jgi:hypothetical protein
VAPVSRADGRVFRNHRHLLIRQRSADQLEVPRMADPVRDNQGRCDPAFGDDRGGPLRHVDRLGRRLDDQERQIERRLGHPRQRAGAGLHVGHDHPIGGS